MKKVIFIVLFSFWLIQGTSAFAEVEVFFAPESNIKEILSKEIESTYSTLEFAIFGITSLDLSHLLLKAKQRGVKVKIVADSKQAKIKSSLITYLINQGIPVKVLGEKERGVMKHRFVILDGKKVVTGSFEWSEASEKWNYENILIITDHEVVGSFQNEFNRLWREKRIIK